jgi:hypothetical protein
VKTADLASSIFWMVFSFIICVNSVQIGTGTFKNPGMGFIGLWAAALLGVTSLTLFIQALLKKEKEKAAPIFKGLLWGKVLAILTALLLYSKFMPVLGYLLSTFVLMCFLFWILKERQAWWWSPIYASVITIITFLVFSVLLNGQYPQGLLGF